MAAKKKTVPSKTRKKVSKKRGRPKKPVDEQQIRLDLIDAAARCLTEQSYRSVSIREIAEEANTTSAMISYYFGNKEGLVIALLENTLTKPRILAEGEAALPVTDKNQRTAFALQEFVTIQQNHPWLSRLIVDDLLNEESTIRDVFLGKIAKNSAAFFKTFVDLQKKEGVYRKDLDTKLTTVSIISLFLMPFIAMPMIREAYGVDMEGKDLDRWVEHTIDILANGIDR